MKVLKTLKILISRIKMMPNYEENVFETQNAHAKLDLFQNMY